MRLGGILSSEGDSQLCGGRRGIFRIFDCVSPTRRALAVCCVTCAACAAIVSCPPKLSPTAGAVRRDAAAQELHVLHEGVVARCRSPAVQCRTGAPLPITINQNCYGTCSGTVPAHVEYSPATETIPACVHPPLTHVCYCSYKAPPPSRSTSNVAAADCTYLAL